LTTQPASEDRTHATSATKEETRQWILGHLREIMTIAMQRVTNPKTPASDRIKWSRIAIAAGQACNTVLRDVEIEALKQQINELKQLTLERLDDQEESGPHEDRTDQARSEETEEED